ncbi:SWR1 complex subunit 2-like [Pyrus ussuriensis x Pyrus communis]|uniref:SWR1 complex subunit 2-like n=1 Tax=Pyrus ussuriensis x Pyrus communis TaxID=2448454 RepID=A0A5N5FA83_9ROSA|nr:SWR1 complex subunit 2-like [Pyrus ussuriensis x Pyrus communis]
MSEEENCLRRRRNCLGDRLFHKNWKVRNEANIDLAALCDSSPIPKTLASLWRIPIRRAREGPRCLIAFLRAADADAGRPKTVEKAQAAFMLWVELEAVDAFLAVSCEVLVAVSV